ncbi:MAG: hypothetical protein LH618_02620 [Saprospiraceae bacterium]|nr:hypothetical protein [Saprospiraceae bacterium]
MRFISASPATGAAVSRGNHGHAEGGGQRQLPRAVAKDGKHGFVLAAEQ